MARVGEITYVNPNSDTMTSTTLNTISPWQPLWNEPGEAVTGYTYSSISSFCDDEKVTLTAQKLKEILEEAVREILKEKAETRETVVIEKYKIKHG